MDPKFLKRIVASYVREKEVPYLEFEEKGRGGGLDKCKCNNVIF